MGTTTVLTRFLAVGVVNTAIDVLVFLLLHDPLGIVLANLVSTSAGMAFSFVVNGLFTFRAGRLTMRDAALFLAINGVTMWVISPVVIHLGIALTGSAPVAKLTAVAVCLGVNFAAYRFVVWARAGDRTPAGGLRPAGPPGP